MPITDTVYRVNRYLRIGRTYYIDPTNGNDNNNGSYQNPLASFAPITANSMKLSDGDKVLLVRGGTMKAQSITIPASGAPGGRGIYFGAYGSGANPILDPTTRYTDFTLDSGSIWKRTETLADPKQCFQDGARLIYETAKASMVAGSWCYVSNVVYVWCTDSGNPNSGHTIEYPATGDVIALRLNGQSNLIFDSWDITKTNYCAINTNAAGSNNILIQNGVFSYSGIRSVLLGADPWSGLWYPSNITVFNCTGHDDLDLSFWAGDGWNLRFVQCTTYNSGLDLSPRGKNYPAATHYPNGFLISKAAINCMVKACYAHDVYGTAFLDELSGGGHSTNSIWDRNIADVSATTVYGASIAGINTLFINNKIISNATSNALNLTNTPTVPLIYHNTLYSPSNGANTLETSSQPGAIVKNNIIVRAGGTSGRFISVAAAAQTGFAADNNQYYQPSGTLRWFWGPTEYTTFANWKSNSGKDAHGLNSDPVFVTNYTDLHLQGGSPCKGAGATGLGVTWDLDSVVRASPPSIGAYE